MHKIGFSMIIVLLNLAMFGRNYRLWRRFRLLLAFDWIVLVGDAWICTLARNRVDVKNSFPQEILARTTTSVLDKLHFLPCSQFDVCLAVPVEGPFYAGVCLDTHIVVYCNSCVMQLVLKKTCFSCFFPFYGVHILPANIPYHELMVGRFLTTIVLIFWSGWNNGGAVDGLEGKLWVTITLDPSVPGPAVLRPREPEGHRTGGYPVSRCVKGVSSG